MNKKGFVRALNRRLRSLSREERQKSLAYYTEMIHDGMEEGLSEEQAVARLGSAEEIAGQLLNEGGRTPAGERRRISTGWMIALAVMAAPVWLSIGAALLGLAAAAAAVVLSVYISLWAALVSLYAAGAALLLCGPLGLLGLAMGLLKGNWMQGLFFLAAGCVTLGSGLLLLPLLNCCARGIGCFTRRSFRAVGKLFGRRRA